MDCAYLPDGKSAVFQFNHPHFLYLPPELRKFPRIRFKYQPNAD
jgi:hypothetical protein